MLVPQQALHYFKNNHSKADGSATCPLMQLLVHRHVLRRCLRERPSAPVPSHFWAAGFSFAPSAWLVDVPYCPHLPHLFFGEEQYMLLRMWTRGWDVYAPTQAVTFHQWERKARANSYQACVKVSAAAGRVHLGHLDKHCGQQQRRSGQARSHTSTLIIKAHELGIVSYQVMAGGALEAQQQSTRHLKRAFHMFVSCPFICRLMLLPGLPPKSESCKSSRHAALHSSKDRQMPRAKHDPLGTGRGHPHSWTGKWEGYGDWAQPGLWRSLSS